MIIFSFSLREGGLSIELIIELNTSIVEEFLVRRVTPKRLNGGCIYHSSCGSDSVILGGKGTMNNKLTVAVLTGDS